RSSTSSSPAVPTSTTCSSTSSPSPDEDRRLRSPGDPREADREPAWLGRRGRAGPARAAQPTGEDRARGRRGGRRRGGRRRLRRLRDAWLARRLPPARGRALLRGLRRGARAGDVLPDRLPRPQLRPRRLARARARPAPRAARRLLPPLHPCRLAGADAYARASGRRRAGRVPPGPAPGDAPLGRRRPGASPGTTRRRGDAVLTNTMPRYEILSEEALETIDHGWRRIVSDLGIEFLHPEALAQLRDAGQQVEGELVRFDPDWILQQVAKAPHQFELQARNPANTVTIGGDNMVFSSVYACPFVRE